MSNKIGNANIEFDLHLSYQNSGLPALVGNVGVIGEYFIQPDNARQYEVGFQPDGVEADTNFAPNLNDAVSILNEKFGVDISDLSLIWQLEEALNVALAKPIPFFFQAVDLGLSSNPSLSVENADGQYYIVWDQEYIAGFIATDDHHGGVEERFPDFKGAVNHLIAKHAVKINDASKREVDNFLAYAKLTTLE